MRLCWQVTVATALHLAAASSVEHVMLHSRQDSVEERQKLGMHLWRQTLQLTDLMAGVAAGPQVETQQRLLEPVLQARLVLHPMR